MDDLDNDVLYANVISLAVEKALLDFGIPILNKVEELLEIKYQMRFADCIRYPDKVAKVLCDVFGVSYIEIVKKIEVNLRNINNNPKSENFMKVITSAISSQ